MNLKNVIFVVFFITSFPVCYQESQNNLNSEDVESHCETNPSTPDFYMLSDNTSFIGSNNSLTFSLSSKIKTRKIEGRNLKVLDDAVNGDKLYVNVDVKNVFSELFVTCTDVEGKDISGNYYLYKKDGITYVSAISIDSAIEKAGDDPMVIHAPVTQSLIEIPDSEPVSYKGKLEWKDDKGNVYPLAGAKVSAKVKIKLPKPAGATILTTKSTYTDSKGSFDLGTDSFNAVANTFTLSLSNQFVSLYHVDNNDQETMGFDSRTDLYEMNLDQYLSCFKLNQPLIISSTTQNSFGSDFGQATQIFEAMHYYSQFAKRKIAGTDLSLCKVYYPCGANYMEKENGKFKDIITAFYNRNYQTIYLPSSKSQRNPNLAVYQSFDVIGHEYGHHIGNITGYCTANVGGQHSSMKDDVRTIAGNNKTTQEHVNRGLTLAWLESWPTYWSQIAQESFPSDLKEKYYSVGDHIYDAYNFSGKGYSIAHNENFDEKEKYYNICGGDAFERGIMRFLYEINRTIGGYESNVSVSVDNLWDLLKGSYEWLHTNFPNDDPTFGYFYEYLYEETMFSKKYKHMTFDELCDITSSYWFSPLKVRTVKNANKITLTWTQGGDYSEETTNSYCYLEFLNKDGAVLQHREIKATKFDSKIDNTYWFKTDLDEPLSGIESLSDVSQVLLCYSPRSYLGKSGLFSPSYSRIIWKGENFSMDAFASIKLDKELEMYVTTKS